MQVSKKEENVHKRKDVTSKGKCVQCIDVLNESMSVVDPQQCAPECHFIWILKKATKICPFYTLYIARTSFVLKLY